jgi:ribosome-associated translation inhibitor RaiA
MKKEIKENKQTQVKFLHLDSAPMLKEYILRKIKTPKFSGINLRAPEILIKKDAKSGPNKYIVSVTIIVNNVKMYFSEVGSNLYALVDAVVDKINRKISKFRSNFKYRRFDMSGL